MGNNFWILLAFVVYCVVMLVIGFVNYSNTKDSKDYFLGGRNLGGWVAALSAQASDMSGWLLMGLPGAIYSLGTGQIWIAVGLCIGTITNWVLVASKLRIYTIKAGDAVTLPSFFENRFEDNSKILKLASAIFITIFFLIYTASAFSSWAVLCSTVFGVDYTISMLVGALIILIYTLLGGFLAVCWTDFVQGFLMLITLVLVPCFAVIAIGGFGEMSAVYDSIGSKFLNPLYSGGGRMGFIEIISQLAWGLGYFGMPHILVRFMAIKNEDEVRKSRKIGIIWVIISLAASCILGTIGRAYFHANPLENSESVFIQMINSIFTQQYGLPFIAGILLCGILAAIMSTADSQLLVTASAISEDVYKGVINKNASEKTMLWVSRITVVVVSIIAFIIALDPDSSIMGLVSNAWSGFGSTFGPVILLSLFWGRSNRAGAASGMIAGGLTVIIWDYIKIGVSTLSDATGLYSLVPGFAMGLIFMILVSLITAPPSDSITKVFKEVQNYK